MAGCSFGPLLPEVMIKLQAIDLGYWLVIDLTHTTLYDLRRKELS